MKDRTTILELWGLKSGSITATSPLSGALLPLFRLILIVLIDRSPERFDLLSSSITFRK
jgi:hypothetical protein